MSSDQGSQGKLSPFLQRQRVAAARPHIKGYVLDIGCGNGVLADLVLAGNYLGVDRDEHALSVAESRYQKHKFQSELPVVAPAYDTVVSLAVIEHIPDPGAALAAWSGFMKPSGCMVLTTPHPSFEWAHETGAKVGLFSHDAAEEHEEMIDLPRMKALLEGTYLRVRIYRRFLFGVNQLFVLEWQ
jgi:2-polyprenyl-3-methyl-5-hydroxy-6-metoxy-1,4-benzoquinol methylase